LDIAFHAHPERFVATASQTTLSPFRRLDRQITGQGKLPKLSRRVSHLY
jgi:hypothetical protein